MNATAQLPVSSPTVRPRTLETTLAVLLAISIALIFWSQQRYPALLKKMHSGASIQMKGAISFDALLKTTPDMPAPKRVLRTSINWLYTNRFGMYFALPFGAAMMTLFASSAAPRRFNSSAANIACGMVAGAPLGVCTNCATPIGQSLLMGGASTRLTVATMISSPSFNPVVLAMAFVLFPLPIALARVIVPLLLLLSLPLLVPESRPAFRPMTVPMFEEAVSQRLLAFARTYLNNLLRITVATLPWMVLAAFIGALAAELIPAYATHVPVSALGVVAVAIFGTVLPVPMALDVALAFILYHAGVPTPYVVALLCTLGPVSVYSISALSKQLGKTTGFRLAAATAGLGTIAGLITLYYR
ncbi:MAG TPA: permease [Acidisarcina sp.]